MRLHHAMQSRRTTQGGSMSARDMIHDALERFASPHYNVRLYETLRGEGGFWPVNNWKRASDGPDYDAEQHLAVFCAVQRACQCQGTPADRWAVVERELVKLAHQYAVDA
jgi:hypothetical protein